MKKFLAIFLVLTLLFSFAACNKDDVNSGDDTTTEQNGEQTTNKKPPFNKGETTTAEPFENPNLTEPAALFKIVKAEDYNFIGGTPKTTATSGVTFIAKRYDNKNFTANTFSANISTGNANLILNETLLKDVIAQGWTIMSKNDANTSIVAGGTQSVFLKSSQGEAIKFAVANKNSTSVALADCVITEVGILKTITEQTWADFAIDGKTVTGDMSYADYVNAFGNPKTISVNEFYQGNDYEYCKTTLVFEKVEGNLTWTVTVGAVDENGKTTIESCIFGVK